MMIPPYQRIAPEDVQRRVQEIRAAVEEGDDELAHRLEDELYHTIVTRLAQRGSRIAKAALESREIKFRRSCA